MYRQERDRDGDERIGAVTQIGRPHHVELGLVALIFLVLKALSVLGIQLLTRYRGHVARQKLPRQKVGHDVHVFQISIDTTKLVDVYLKKNRIFPFFNRFFLMSCL